MRNIPLIISWSLYDLANQFFLLNVVSLYFVRWLTLEKGVPEIFYSISFGISMFLVAVLAPLLGTISDLTKRRRPFLVYFTLLSVGFTIALSLSQNIFLELFFFAIANFGCQIAVVFYNAQIVDIAPKNRIGLVSGFGRMLAYTGAILALYIVKPVVLKNGYQAAFLPTGILFLVFSLPCLIFVKDKTGAPEMHLIDFFRKERIIQVFNTLKRTALESKMYPGLLDFLKATFFGFSAVNVIILFMSIYATRVFGLSEAQIVNLIAFSTLFAIIGSLFSGFISDFLGYKRCLLLAFILWGFCFFAGAFIRSVWLYWFVGAGVGFALGSTWVVSRALAVKLIPEEKIGEMFGLCNLVGYLAAVLGAVFWGILLLLLSGLAESGYRVALLSLVLFMLFGIIYLLRLPDDI